MTSTCLVLCLPASAPGASMWAAPSDRVKMVARQAARLCGFEDGQEPSPVPWTLEVIPEKGGGFRVENVEQTLEDAGVTDWSCVVPVPLVYSETSERETG